MSDNKGYTYKSSGTNNEVSKISIRVSEQTTLTPIWRAIITVLATKIPAASIPTHTTIPTRKIWHVILIEER